MTATGNGYNLPRCPNCGSIHIHLKLRPGARIDTEDRFSTFINATSKKCASCLHEWDQKETRGVRWSCDPPRRVAKRKRRLWASLWAPISAFYHSIFPIFE
jgi:hypothetical protein